MLLFLIHPVEGNTHLTHGGRNKKKKGQQKMGPIKASVEIWSALIQMLYICVYMYTHAPYLTRK